MFILSLCVYLTIDVHVLLARNIALLQREETVAIAVAAGVVIRTAFGSETARSV